MGGVAGSADVGGGLTRITDLPAAISLLRGEARARADRLLDVRVVTGRTDPPPGLEGWLRRTFGSVDRVREQTVVKVTNRATLEATLFAPLRMARPIDGAGTSHDLRAEIAATEGDPFCSPETGTPADTFGRVRGARTISGANAAVADAHHAVLVFDDHDPLAFDAALVADLFATGHAWAARAAETDPAASNYLLIWNCLWRAGGSIIHGHAQVLLGSGPHYAKLERLRRDAAHYRERHGAELVTDLVQLHNDLGLAASHDGVAVMAHVTPAKEREVVIVGQHGMDERDPAFTSAVSRVLTAYRDGLGVRSFNLALWRAPLGGDGDWDWLPPVVRLVDRGDPAHRPSDIGAMELYGTPIVGSDPYDVMAVLAAAVDS